MNKQTVNKRKSVNEMKHHVEPKLRKKDNLETLTKQTICKKYKELEDKYLKVVSDFEKLKQTNESLSNKIKTLEIDTPSQKPQSVSETQTTMLDKDFKFPCQICIYNADSEFDLRIHMEYVHDFDDGFCSIKIKCNICKTKFKGKKYLMNHIKTKHGGSLPPCKYFQNGTCKFTENSCWFVHKREEMPTMKCRHCEEKFFFKSEVMNHQKSFHEELLPICKNFVKGNCKFQSKCWFQHWKYINPNETNNTDDSEYDDNDDSSTHETNYEEY